MIVHSYYPDDPRVRRETEALRDDGWTVDVICLRNRGEEATEHNGMGTIYRLPVRRHRGRGLLIYLLEYLAFFCLAFLRVSALHLRRRYTLVQVHNMPDFLVFTALVPKLLGARVLLDIHDLVPELYALRFASRANHPFLRAMYWIEQRSTAFADHVLTAGEPFRRILVQRGTPDDKITVIMNSADPRLFSPLPDRTRQQEQRRGEFRLVYHGGLFERYGIDLAIEAVHRLRRRIPGLRFDIYGEGEAEGDLERLVQALDLSDHVHLGGFIPIDEIPERIGRADLGVVPYRQNPFNELLYPTKAFEYLAMDVPVILSRTGAVYDLFAGIPIMLVTPEDVDELAERILMLYENGRLRNRLLQAAKRAYKAYAWDVQSQRYLEAIEDTISSRSSHAVSSSIHG